MPPRKTPKKYVNMQNDPLWRCIHFILFRAGAKNADKPVSINRYCNDSILQEQYERIVCLVVSNVSNWTQI